MDYVCFSKRYGGRYYEQLGYKVYLQDEPITIDSYDISNPANEYSIGDRYYVRPLVVNDWCSCFKKRYPEKDEHELVRKYRCFHCFNTIYECTVKSPNDPPAKSDNYWSIRGSNNHGPRQQIF